MDPRAFMLQHIQRLVRIAQLAESMGCEYFGIFGDEIEQLVASPIVTDLWVQAITRVREVFSGKLTSTSSWGEHGGGFTFDHQPQIVSMLDVLGIGFFPAYTDHPDPTVAELVTSYTSNSQGHNSLLSLIDMHTLYQKPIAVTDEAYGSFRGASVQGQSVLFGQFPPSQFVVDNQEQVNLYQAFFQAIPTLDPSWMLGTVMDSFDRLPYTWKDVHLPPYLGSLGESIRGKPALQILTQSYQTNQPVRTPASGWWYSSGTGAFYTIEAENGVVRLGSLSYSSQGNAQWTLARCVQTELGTYVGTVEQYVGGWALNQAPTPPTGIVDGPPAKLVFNSATTASLQIGTQTVFIQRYQFSDQWASPMLNAPRVGWWDQPTQSGRGYFLEVQGNTLYVGGLIYSRSGQPTWFTSTGPVDSMGGFSGNLSVCSAQLPSADGAVQVPDCKPTTDTIRLAFGAPWRATLMLGQESPVEIRRYRQTEIGWSGPTPAFALPNPVFVGESSAANAATLSTGIAPGSIATIFGTGLTRGVEGVVAAPSGTLPYSLQGTSVLVNGIPAPVFAVVSLNGLEQIYFQVPWEVQGEPIPQVPISPIITTKQPAASIVVVNNGSVSPAMRAFSHDLQPAIFTSDGSHAIAVHADHSLVNSQNPSHSGEVITLYGTGFGPVTPLPPTGAPAGVLPQSTMDNTPTVTVNAHNATVVFAGLSPGSVGLYQFDLVIPSRVGIGDLNVLLNIGGQNSNLVTIPVQ
jgi:uncharacterized protein (TIGR03437 family)